jgi:hypothetical protein
MEFRCLISITEITQLSKNDEHLLPSATLGNMDHITA